MDLEAVAAFALRFPEVTEEQPFGPDVDVYKVDGKVFLLLAPERGQPTISVKCDPGLAVQLRAEYEAVIPGYHLNKRHWNTVILDGSIPDDEIEGMVSHSYDRVVAGLPKAVRQRLSPTD
jgi:predicted DNA-binding protein (MmcQ/YjbR family)